MTNIGKSRANAEDSAALIDRLVRRISDVPYDGNIALNRTEWDWPAGVGLYGVCRAWMRTGNRYYGDFARAWVDEYLPQAELRRTINGIAPLLAVFELYRETGIERYGEACRAGCDWLLKEAPRTREGAFEHTVNEQGPGFREQIWADTLFMSCILLAKMGALDGTDAYAREAALQLNVHLNALRDGRTGLYRHAWNCERRDWMSGALWGRANAWILVSAVEMLEILPESFGGRDQAIGQAVELGEALARAQRGDGLFGTLLDDPEAYGEASATAGIAYGLRRGVRSGFLPEALLSCAKRAEAAVRPLVNERGELEQVSHGTDVKPDLEAYKKVPIVPAFWGQGLALLMLCEDPALQAREGVPPAEEDR
ncbi:glycoside hydrolase family 88/105 protein [Cohnella hongkongensis]|uniref:Glycoside hydrolase family 105 protein n=1 Tax=Cohnella hongkongensis TaxID=178337 RepID=A0ABV9F8X3_9BACL